MLNPTPREGLTDENDRPYFLWDCDLTLEQFEHRLHDPDPEVRAYLVGKLMRQAKPDDVFLIRIASDHPRALAPSPALSRPYEGFLDLAVRDLGGPRPCLAISSRRSSGGSCGRSPTSSPPGTLTGGGALAGISPRAP